MAGNKEVFVEKREGERVRIGFSDFEGREYIDIRQYYQNEEEEWRPTKKGVTLPIESLDDLKDAVSKLSASD